MGELRFVAIDGERLGRMREKGEDEFGNVWRGRAALGWEPLRCCLRVARVGEEIALICYTPWVEASPWLEAGPVFVHFGECGGYGDEHEYPVELRGGERMLNPFDGDGVRIYEHIAFVREGDDPEEAVRRVMGMPGVAYLHVRSAAAGCFTFEVRPGH